MGSPNKLVVIGAGLPRTGTLTMKTALQELLGGKCYHMIEFIESGKKFESEFWRNALEGKLEDAQWVDFLERRDFRATVDYPSSFFYKVG